MKFKTEADVRAWVKRKAWGELVWIENKSGGTVGASDLVLVNGPNSVFIELKLAETVKGALYVKAQSAQRIFSRKINDAGGRSFFLAGVKNTRTIITFDWRDMQSMWVQNPREEENGAIKIENQSRYILLRWEQVADGFDPFSLCFAVGGT